MTVPRSAVVGKDIWDDIRRGAKNVWNGVTGKGITPPTKENHVIKPDSPADKAISGAGDVISGTGDFFSALGKGETWVRVGEVVVGLAFLIVGVDHMFNTDIAGKVAKVAPYAAI